VLRTYDSKISREGRASVPSEVRRALGVRAGDVIHFVMDDKGVRVVTAKTLTAEIWANNHSATADADAGVDSADHVRAERAADAEAVADKWAALSDAEPDDRSDTQVEADLLASLGLPR
jgi:bifunctional DNA-binding transcriptional regulator/antitoxin component of YhaV-PrlF toxin-antitoxin module